MTIGNVQNAVPVGVFPLVLSRSRSRSEMMLGRYNDYPSGDHQGVCLVATPRWVWDQELVCTEDELATVEDFYADHVGSMVPFYFYEGVEASPQWTADPTGSSVIGRYVARFDGPIGRANVVGSLFTISIRIVQLA